MDEQPDKTFAFNDRHRREIAAIFGQGLGRADEAEDRVSLIEEAVRHFVAHHVNVEPHHTAKSSSIPRAKRKQIDRLLNQIQDLRSVLAPSISPKMRLPDEDDLRSNLLGCLALTGPVKRQRVPFGEDETPALHAFLESGSQAAALIDGGLDHLARAAQLWREYYTGAQGRKTKPTDALVLYLYFTCYPASFGAEAIDASPSAPNSRLTRTLGVVLEGLGWPVPANIEQTIRRALERADGDEEAAASFIDQVQGFADQN